MSFCMGHCEVVRDRCNSWAIQEFVICFYRWLRYKNLDFNAIKSNDTVALLIIFARRDPFCLTTSFLAAATKQSLLIVFIIHTIIVFVKLAVPVLKFPHINDQLVDEDFDNLPDSVFYETGWKPPLKESLFILKITTTRNFFVRNRQELRSFEIVTLNWNPPFI